MTINRNNHGVCGESELLQELSASIVYDHDVEEVGLISEVVDYKLSNISTVSYDDLSLASQDKHDGEHSSIHKSHSIMTTSKHSVEHQCLIFQTEPRILEEDEGLPEQLITCEITPNIEMVVFEENESDSVDEIADFCHLDRPPESIYYPPYCYDNEVFL